MDGLNKPGERIEAALKAMNARKSDLARVLGKSQATVSSYFLRTRQLTRATLEQIADGLNALARDVGLRDDWTVPRLLGQAELPDASLSPWEAATHARRLSAGSLMVRHYESVHCGIPDVGIEQEVPTMMNIPREAAGTGAVSDNVYSVAAHGQSMIAAGIKSGSDLVCRTDIEPRPGDVVVAVVNGAPCCRVYEKQDDVVMLVSRSAEQSAPIVIRPTDEVSMHVVVSALVYFREH